MKKIVSFLVIISACFLLNKVNAEEYESYKSGDLVRYNDIAFYVMYDSSSEEDSVQLLKMVPLSHEEIDRYTDNKANVSTTSNGNFSYTKSNTQFSLYGNMAYYYDNNCYCSSWGDSNISCYNQVSNTCKNDYDSSNVKKVVDAWELDNINEDDIVIDEYGYKARLLEVNDLSYFDSALDFSTNNSEYDLSDFPKWLVLLNENAWTMNNYEKCYYYYGGVLNYCDKNVYYFETRKAINNVRYYLNSAGVYEHRLVRPTIKLKKSSIKKIEFNEYHDNRVREYKIGDIINYNDISFYVIKDSSEDDKTVTLIKRNPLTGYELNKYGEGYINNYIYSYKGNEITPGTVIYDKGLYKVAYLSTINCYHDYIHEPFSSDYSGCNGNYDTSNVKHIVDNWLFDTISEEDIAKDIAGYYARLINSDDIIDLGYVSIQANTAGDDNFKVSNDTPEFMMDDNAKGMLTMINGYTYYSSYDQQTCYGITIADDGYNFLAQSIPNDAIGTVRPVVTLNKKEIAKKITNVEDYEETDNIEVTIEAEVDNEIVINEKNNEIVSVPNTLLKKGIILVIIGIALAILSSFIVVYVKKKK